MTNLPSKAAHSLLSASASERWTNCPGSVAMGLGMRSGSSAAALEGTALHELTAECLEKGKEPDDYVEITFKSDGKLHTFELNDEQRDCVKQVVDYVRSRPGLKFFETKVNYGEALGQDNDKAFGTADIICVDGGHVEVLDAKFGRRFVDREQNKQMLLYAIGAVDAVEALGDDVETLGLNILQPRVGGKVCGDPWTLTRAELTEWQEFFRKKAVEVTEAIDSFPGIETKEMFKWESRYLMAGEKQCQWCPAAGVCPQLEREAKLAENSVQDSDGTILEEFATKLSEGRLALALERLPLLETYSKAVEAEAFKRLETGDKIRGYKLIKGRAGHRKWADEKVAAEKLKALGVDPFGEPKIKSPAQADKLVKKIDGGTEAVAELVTRNPPKPALVKEAVPGEAWAASATIEEFDQ